MVIHWYFTIDIEFSVIVKSTNVEINMEHVQSQNTDRVSPRNNVNFQSSFEDYLDNQTEGNDSETG